MTRAELEELIDRVRRRHNRRVMAVFGMMTVVLFGSFASVDWFVSPRRGAQRDQWVWLVAGVLLVVSAGGFLWVFGRAKKDCVELGVVCPACRRHLYSRRRLLFGGPGTRKTGQCPHCAHQLIDGEPALGQPLVTGELVKRSLLQVLVGGGVSVVVFWLMWKLGFLSAR